MATTAYAGGSSASERASTVESTTATDLNSIHIALDDTSSGSDQSSAPTDDDRRTEDEAENTGLPIAEQPAIIGGSASTGAPKCHAEEDNYGGLPLSSTHSRSQTNDTGGGRIGLLERIVRSHPIWFLPHLPRSAATHLLKGKRPGLFLVRQSSKTQRMALTIRLPPGHPAGVDTDHYLIETTGGDGGTVTGSSGGVRVQGSPHHFPSLPFLLEYYCSNGDELQIQLTLPAAVMNCESRGDLQSVALLGQVFWSSGMGVLPSSDVSPPTVQQATSSMRKSESAHERLPSVPSKKPSPPLKPNRLKQGIADGIMVAPGTTDAESALAPLHGRSQSANGGTHTYGATAEQQHQLPAQQHRASFRLKQWLFNSGDTTPPNLPDAYTQNQPRTFSFSTPPVTVDVPTPPCSCPADAGGSTERRSVPQPPPTVTKRQGAGVPRSNTFGFGTATAKPALKPKPPNAALRQHPLQHPFSSPTGAKRGTRWQSEDSGSPVAALRNTIGDQGDTARTTKVPSAVLSTNTVNSSSTPKNSVEELRKRRLDSATVNRPPAGETQLISTKDGSPHVVRRRRQPPKPAAPHSFVGGRTPSSATASTDSRFSTFARHTEHRLSAPNLAELLANATTGGERETNHARLYGTTQSGTKWGRAPATGELQTINEGLVTPAVRRRRWPPPVNSPNQRTMAETPERQQDVPPPRRLNADEQFKQSLENLLAVTGGGAPPERSKQTTGIFHRTHSERSSPRKQPHSVQKETVGGSMRMSNKVGNVAAAAAYVEANVSVVSSPIPIAPLSDCSPLAPPVHHWSAVNNEMRNRQQKVAKVHPTVNPSKNTKLRSSLSRQQGQMDEQAATRSSVAPPVLATTVDHRSLSPFSVSSVDSCVQQTGSVAPPLADYLLPRSTPQRHPPRRSASLRHRQQAQPSAGDADRDNDDVCSLAGTVFNEPWDSGAWEALADLALYGDKQTTPNTSDSHQRDSGEYGCVVFSRPEVQKPPVPSRERKKPPTTLEEFAKRVPPLSHTSLPTAVTDSSSRPTDTDNSNTTTPTSTPLVRSRQPRSMTTAKRVPPPTVVDRSPEEELRALLHTPVISPARLRQHHAGLSAVSGCGDPGLNIQEYIETVAADATTVFGATVQQFIQCTKEAEQCDPHIVLRNVRQFMNGIKNYLNKHGEGQLLDLIDRERSRLQPTEFLNIDAIFEGVLHKIVLDAVKPHLYHLMIQEASRSGALTAISRNLTEIRAMDPKLYGLGISRQSRLPTQTTVDAVRTSLRQMQHQFSPVKKLEYLLKAVSDASSASHHPDDEARSSTPNAAAHRRELPAADDLVRWLVFVLSRCSVVGCEIEAHYMWYLLPQQLLTGDASYYLTALFSAVRVLKHPECLPRLGRERGDGAAETLLGFEQQDDCDVSLSGTLSSLNTLGGPLCSDIPITDAFIRVAIPDEVGGTIRYHKFPGVHQMTADKLCKIIAHKFGITNPEDHGLYLIVAECETCLLPAECPDVVRDQMRADRKPHMFAYKRHQAKIAWPKVAIASPILPNNSGHYL